MIRNILILWFSAFYALNINSQTIDTLKYYTPYIADSSNVMLFSDDCDEPGWCEPVAVWFTPDSIQSDSLFNYYSIKEVRIFFSDIKDTAYSIHIGNQLPDDSNRAYRETFTLTLDSINQDFLYNGNYQFTAFNVSQVKELQNISIDNSFWVQLEGNVFHVYNTTRFGIPASSSGHSFISRTNSWEKADCDWIMETVVQYHKDKINGLTDPRDNILPKQSFLYQNYPNPFNSRETQIKYTLQTAGYVEVNIYAVDGKKIASLVRKQQNKGTFIVKLSVSDLVSGIYFYNLVIDHVLQDSRKMILVK